MPELLEMRQRVIDLTTFYRLMKHTFQPDGKWDAALWQEIEEIEAAIAARKKEMAAVEGDRVVNGIHGSIIPQVTGLANVGVRDGNV